MESKKYKNDTQKNISHFDPSYYILFLFTLTPYMGMGFYNFWISYHFTWYEYLVNCKISNFLRIFFFSAERLHFEFAHLTWKFGARPTRYRRSWDQWRSKRRGSETAVLNKPPHFYCPSRELPAASFPAPNQLSAY